MANQLGRCAFTAACSFPGRRFRVSGTDQEVCRMHARTYQLAVSNPMRVARTEDAPLLARAMIGTKKGRA